MQTVRGASEVQVLRDGDEASPRRDRTPLPPEAERVLGRGNTEGTPPRVRASTRSHSSSRDSLSLRGFRARGVPAVPAVPASLLDGKEGVDGSSPSEGSAKWLQKRCFRFILCLQYVQPDDVWSTFWSTWVETAPAILPAPRDAVSPATPRCGATSKRSSAASRC